MSRRSALSALGGLLAAGLLLPALSTALLPTPASASGPVMAPAAPKPKPSSSPKGNGGGRPQPATPTPTPTPTPTRSPATVVPTPSATLPPAPVATPTAAVFGPASTVGGSTPRRSSSSAPRATPSPSRPAAAAADPLAPADAATPRRRFDQVTESLTSAASNPQLLLGVLAMMLVFLLAQSRIDHKDPKLSLEHEDGDLELAFAAPVRRTDPPVRPRLAPRPRLRVVSRSPYYDQPSALPDHT